MHPSVHAQADATKPAVIMAGSGTAISYGQLDRRSNQIAHYLRGQGIGIGDTVALCLENRAEYFDVVWGAQRAGLIFGSVDANNTVAYRQVVLGLSVDGMRIVEKGLTAGDRIVVNGLQRIRPGATVAPEPVPMAEKSELRRGADKTELAQR